MPGAERFLVREELLVAPPLFSFWYSMGDWRAARTSEPPFTQCVFLWSPVTTSTSIAVALLATCQEVWYINNVTIKYQYTVSSVSIQYASLYYLLVNVSAVHDGKKRQVTDIIGYIE